ncbi:MFS transporter [Nocardia farcinica]|uniref:Spectinomycin tetracycline efflux pump n=3 Tax=Nocardia farcinica TaxID=37329 RepID=A0A0H5NZP3_NOCFR|nr:MULTISPECIES: MFS transporter [Nocardia]AXK86988.1 MFS transporter [Nocardia farcinica]MBA4855732.1 MFS transporter [Nocardia farcinica]MBC9815698.1 MFS transporter [Nocardia farcinica]MBF6072516.1 MFS transporter [Nocardia farcinica]MBF6188319.1 MFS transporter [Nocardia farcinica]
MTSPATLSAAAAPALDPTKWPVRLWGMLITLCVVLFLDGLDVSMIGVALPSIGAELDMSTSTLQWLVSGYVLGYGGLLLLGGRTADLLGRRKVFLIALAVFALASLAGGLVSSGPLLILTRFVKGLAAAFTAPTGLSIITTTFAEGPARNKALSIYTVFGAGGYSSGLLFGGLMTGMGWRWTFLLPVPIALAALAAAWVLVPKDEPAEEGGHDLLGAALSTAAMLLLVYTVVTAPEVGWNSARTVGSFAAVAVLFAAFLAVERRVAHPLVRLGILRKTTLVRASLAIVAVAGSYFSWQFIVTLYLQDTLGWSPLRLALALLPVGLLVALSAVFSDKLVDRFGTGPIIGVTMTVMAVGYLLFLRLDTHPSYLTMILPAVLLIGIGWIGFPAINIQATSGIDDDEQGLAAGVLQTAMQVGGAVMLAVTTAVISSGGHGSGEPQQMLDAYRPGLTFAAGIAVVGALVALSAFAPALRRRRAAEPEVELVG